MIPDYLRGLIEPRDVLEVCRRVDELVTMNNASKDSQKRVRDLMDGGVKGLEALVGRAGQKDMNLLGDLPAGNPLLSGLTHLSTKLQQVPDLRVTPAKDTDQAKKQAETREHILWHLDDQSNLEAQMPQVGMWLPGYGFSAWVINPRRDNDGQLYPHVELRDPLETYPGDFGVEQQPADVAFIRHIATKKLVQMYPQFTRDILQIGAQGGSMPVGDNISGWASQSAGVRVAEYYDHRGQWWVVPERNICLEFRPNLLSRPQFVIPKRFAFHQLQGQYDHVIGLMAMTARLTVMHAQWVQDNVHGETNIYGQAPAEYRKGRFAVNEFDPGTRVERVTNQMPFQAFQAIDRLERQLRSTARYPVTDDAQSPAAWATGAGLDELGAAQTLEIRTYQTQIRRSVETLDSLRLEWEDRHYRGTKRTLAGERKGQRFAETYDPAVVIDGNYRTRRKFGFMAGWDESRKLVGGLQLVAAGIIPKAIMRENLDGLDESLLRTEELIDAEMAEEVMKAALMQRAQQGDPLAMTAVIQMMPAGETRNILESVFIPKEEEMAAAAPEEALPEQPPGLEELFQNPQMLARMSQNGNPNSGGVQTMMSMGPGQ